MFGHGRYNAGILIELEVGYEIDTSDAKQVEEARNKLQLALERMNMSAPQHARVQKEMILFATLKKPFIYNPFRTAPFSRRGTLAEYRDEINVLYKTIARAAYMALKPPKIWNPEKSLIYVRGIIATVLGKILSDDADLFEHGIDSIQATRIRIILFRALQSTTKVDTRNFSGSIVHRYRTIARLATFANRVALACFRRRTQSRLERCLEMREMIEYYSLDFPEHRPSMPLPCDDVVLITGTTGLLGSSLLARLLQSPTVATVYALNRRKSRPGSVANRQAALLQASGLDPALTLHPKLTFLEADARLSHLGLSQELYGQLLSSVTHIVHNAWLCTYDDSLPLHAFEDSFCMLCNLVEFALSSPLTVPPRLLFISTTDILRGSSESPLGCAACEEEESDLVAPQGPVSPCDVAGGVYGESKWVGEQILITAASETPLRPIIVRMGPLCGAPNGRWREDAHLPAIVHFGATLGALPKIDEVVHWIPVHTAAKVVVEMRNARSTHLHITHPHPISSLALLRYISEELRLPLIALSKWTAKLEESVHATLMLPLVPCPSPTLGPAVHARPDAALALLRHIWHAGTEDPTAMDASPTWIFGNIRIASSDAWVASSTLPGHGGVRVLGIEDVRIWLQHWREVGMIPPRLGPPIVARHSQLEACYEPGPNGPSTSGAAAIL